MAGVLPPTWFLLIVLGLVLFGRHHFPAGLERAIIFPMAAVPNVWGLWNLLYVSLYSRERASIGVFGAALPFLLVPAGLASLLDVRFYTVAHAAIALPVAIAIYYLAWKYGVAFLLLSSIIFPCRDDFMRPRR